MFENSKTLSKCEKHLSTLIRARYPYIYISTWEEQRAEHSVLRVNAGDNENKRLDRLVYSWSLTQGLKQLSGKNGSESYKGKSFSPIEILEEIEKKQEDAIFILKDYHPYLRTKDRTSSFNIVRKLRDLLPELYEGRYSKTLIFISPLLVIPEEMQKEFTILDYALPTEEEIYANFKHIVWLNKVENKLTDSDFHELAKSALGMSASEAENAFSRAIVQEKGLSMSAMQTIFDEKKQVIRKSGLLDYVESDIRIDDIGGLDVLKDWLQKRRNSWDSRANSYNLPAPKGILVTGVPGCGKSLTAKAMSAIWGLPLIQLDMGRIFSGLVGSSEENMRQAIKTAEAMAPCVLWIDEIEKGLSGSGSSNDGGTSTRVFGTLLTWMQEKKSMVFILATSNDISCLKPELLRKGRFDEIFFVDLPTQKEREEILNLHINKRYSDAFSNLNIDGTLITNLAKRTEGFVGSELEAVVISAIFEAFADKRKVREQDFYNAISNTVPLSVTQAEQISVTRKWAKKRAVCATSSDYREEKIEVLNGRTLKF